MRKRNLQIAISVIISAVFLGYALYGIDWAEATKAFASANYWYCLPVFGVTLWQLYIRAQRWHVLLRPIDAPPMSTLVAATNIGWLGNFILPLRAGEIIRPVFAARKENRPLAQLLASVALERIFDMFTILLFLGIAISFLPTSDDIQNAGRVVLGVAVVAAMGMAFLRFQEALANKIIGAVLGPLPEAVSGPLRSFITGFQHSLAGIDSPFALLRLLAWSVYLWTVVSCIFGLGLLMFDLEVENLLLAQISINIIIAVAVSAPSAPGFIGVFQAGCVLAFDLLGLPEEKAFAYSIVLHITQFVAIISAGLYSLARQGMSVSQMGQVSAANEQVARE